MSFSVWSIGLICFVVGVFIGMYTAALLIANKYRVIVYDEDELIDRLADLEHEQWAHWTTYMMAHMTEANTSRWKVQAQKPYSQLSETDKEKDRKWARKVLEVLTDGDI